MKFNKAGNVIRSLVYRIAGSEYQDIVAVSFCWKRILGRLLSERTELIKIEKNVLFVAVNNNVWMQELLLAKHDLIRQIKQQGDVELTDIVFFLKDQVENQQPNYLKRKRKK
jgi:hypothetical protein